MTRNTFEPEEDLEEDTPLPGLEADEDLTTERPGKEEFLEALELRQISMGYSVTRQHTIDRIKRELGFNYPR